MSLPIIIDDRPAVPVRMIPHVTKGLLTPADVVSLLQGSHRLKAWCLRRDGTHRALRRDERLLIASYAYDVQSSLAAEEAIANGREAEMQQEILECLPENAFVWQSDLEQVCELSPENWALDLTGTAAQQPCIPQEEPVMTFVEVRDLLQKRYGMSSAEIALSIKNQYLAAYYPDGKGEGDYCLEHPLEIGRSLDEADVYRFLIGSVFLRHKVQAFRPDSRWLTYQQVVERWQHALSPDEIRGLIEAKMGEHDLKLHCVHPCHSMLRVGKDDLTQGLFPLFQIRAIELEQFQAVPYQAALHMLQTRFPDSTPQELLMWVTLDEIRAYADSYGSQSWVLQPDDRRDDHLQLLGRCHFSKAEVMGFQPHDRFLTHSQLLDRHTTEEERECSGTGVTEEAVDTLSDLALGRTWRERVQKFGKQRAEEFSAERQQEHERWRAEAEKSQKQCKRPLSKRELAGRVKKALKLPDSIETIRKRL